MKRFQFKCPSELLAQLHDDDRQRAQNQEVVNILSAQECIGVFDVEKLLHNLIFLVLLLV